MEIKPNARQVVVVLKQVVMVLRQVVIKRRQMKELTQAEARLTHVEAELMWVGVVRRHAEQHSNQAATRQMERMQTMVEKAFATVEMELKKIQMNLARV